MGSSTLTYLHQHHHSTFHAKSYNNILTESLPAGIDKEIMSTWHCHKVEFLCEILQEFHKHINNLHNNVYIFHHVNRTKQHLVISIRSHNKEED